jgi:hypothetical protein
MMRWPRLILPALLFGVALIWGLNRISQAVPPDEVAVWQGLQARAERVEVLGIGSSLASAIELSELGMDGHLMWTPASDLFENEYTLRLALAAAPRVKLVLVALTPVSLHWSSAARGEDETRRRHYLMGGGDPRAGVIDGDWRNLAIAGALPMVRHDQWRAPVSVALRALGVPAPPLPTLVQDGAWIRLTSHREGGLTEEDRRLIGWQQRGLAAFAARPGGESERLLATLGRMAGMARAQGARIAFFTPPVAPDYLAAMRAAGMPDGRAAFAAAAAREGFFYYDLAEDAAIAADGRNFFDSHHLNVTGARVFTQRLRAMLARDGVL